MKIDRGAAHIDEAKVKAEARYDGKWVLRTNTDLSADQVALKYKQLWQVERVFRDVKSLLLTRPIFHQRDHTIRGHVFCSFLALVLRKELDRCLEQAGQRLEWAEIKQDLKALQTVTIEESGKSALPSASGLTPRVVAPKVADLGRLFNDDGENILEKYGTGERPAVERTRDRLSQTLFKEIYRNRQKVWVNLCNLSEEE